MWNIQCSKIYKTAMEKLCKNCIRRENEAELRKKMKAYKKLNSSDFDSENPAPKDYLRTLNLADARLKFKLRSCMTPTVKLNFKSDAKFAAQLWKCEGCVKLSQNGYMDSQLHILRCEGYADLRYGKDLDNDQHLVEYVRSVLRRRQDSW